MSIALDVGVHRLRSLRRRGERLLGRTIRAAYAALPDTASQRTILERLRVSYATCDDGLVLAGDAAVEYGRSFQAPCRPLLPGSRLPTVDAPARQVLAMLVDALLPEPRQGGEICSVVVPGVPGENEREVEFLTRLVRMNGYRPLVRTSGLSTVLAELGRDSFSGMAVDFGAGTSEVSVCHRGSEVARCTVELGGNWIDERLAAELDRYRYDAEGRRHPDVESVREWKESRTGPVLSPSDETEELLGELCTELVARTIEEAARVIAAEPAVKTLPRPLNVVCSGGVTGAAGFGELVEGVLGKTPFPVEVGAVRVQPNPYTAARGGLIAAEVESSASTAA